MAPPRKRNIAITETAHASATTTEIKRKKETTTDENTESTVASVSFSSTSDNTIENCVSLATAAVDSRRLGFEFFDNYCLDLSKQLLGKLLVRRFEDTKKTVRTRIVEVEAYLGGSDAASHSFNNKCTDRNKAMFMPAGTAYVYNIYGIYCCFNISTKEAGGGVLIRALEPIDEVETLKENRKLTGKEKIKIHKDLTSGPSKLCQALNITKDLFNAKNLCAADTDLWLESDDESAKLQIVSSKRINIDYAGEEACNKLYRFYIKNNKCVSVIDKNAVDVPPLF